MVPFIHLCRLNKPIGIWLLMLPCWWGVGVSLSPKSLQFYYSLVLYFLGAVCLRSVGCIVNDWLDQNYDALIPRTRQRPLASGRLTPSQAFAACVILMMGGFGVWVTLNSTARLLSLVAFMLLLIYPLMKRLTYWPQAVLGLAFNSGILIACAEIDPTSLKTLLPWLLYGVGVLWTLAYDTIYAFQDVEQDQSLKLKSTAVLFHNRPYLLPAICYGCMGGLLLGLGLGKNYSYQYYLGVLLSFLEIGCRLYQWNPSNPTTCLTFFKHNVWLGLSIFVLLIWEKF